MSAFRFPSLFVAASEPARTPLPAINAAELPSFCPLPMPLATAEDERLAFLFRSTLKLGRIHPLYLPIQRYRAASASAGEGASAASAFAVDTAGADRG